MEKGTTNGTITDFDGNFTLNVRTNAKLVVSYVGYAVSYTHLDVYKRQPLCPGETLMPVSAPFIDEVFLSVNDNNISFTFSALNLSLIHI